MSKLDDKIENALSELEVDGSPGSGGWIDSQSRKKATEKLSLLIEDVSEKFAAYIYRTDIKESNIPSLFTYFINNIYGK